MSLRAFHIFFITVSILLFGFVLGWSIWMHAKSLGTISLLALTGLVVYLQWFLSKEHR